MRGRGVRWGRDAYGMGTGIGGLMRGKRGERGKWENGREGLV